MDRSRFAKGFSLLALIGVGAAYRLMVVAGDGGKAGKKETSAPVARYYGKDACADCHRTGPASGDDTLYVCDRTEMKIWEDFDKHGIAFEVLTRKGSLGEKIGKTLGCNPAKDSRCLACHNVTVGGKVNEGVSCVVCHGPDRGKFGWVRLHGPTGPSQEEARKEWRALSRKAKQEEHGMTDLG